MAATAASSKPPPRSVGTGPLVALIAIVILPGAVTLGLLGTLGSTPQGLKGFWDYPSGTIGDSFLLPALAR